MKRRFLPVLLAGMACLMSATYAAAADESLDEMTRLLKLRLGTDNVETPVETGIEGVYQTRFGNKFAYLIEGGRYIFIGDLVDLKLARNLTEASRRELIVEAIAGFSAEKQVVFPAEGEELAVLNVFTDTSCGYCQKLHTEVKYLQQAGISVHYIPYPRGGNRGPGYSDMRKVWCA
jgi:thiol:disulfide interchange protein DsbC